MRIIKSNETAGTDQVTLAGLKAYARINTSAEDSTLQLVLDSSRRMAEDHTGYITRQTSFTLELDGYPEDYTAIIPRYPLNSITSITNTDVDGNATTVTGWYLAGNKLVLPAPTTSCRKLAIVFDAGSYTVPDPLKVAIYALATLRVKYREVTTTDAISDVPFGYDVICNALRGSCLVGGQS